MPEERVAVFVRLPKGQAAALDRLAEATGRRKQQVVSELLADRLPVGRVDRLLLARDAREGAAELQRRSQRWGLASVTAFWSSIAALREVRDAMPPAY